MSRCMKCYSDKGKGTYCDDCRAVIANEKRLQEDGERMELEAKAWVKDAMEADYFNPDFKLMKDAAIQDFKAGFNKALDLVMEEIYSAAYNDRGIMTIEESELKAIISKLRGEK